jgi:hypothetical protein
MQVSFRTNQQDFGEPAPIGVALLPTTLCFLFAHLILHPFCNRQLNQMRAVSQISLPSTLVVGLMTIFDVFMKKEADLAASGPWGVVQENSVHELNRKIFAMIAILVNVTTFLLPVLLTLNGLDATLLKTKSRQTQSAIHAGHCS